MKLVINVTQEDIEKGERGECARCPVARALQRATGDPIADVIPGEHRGLSARFHATSVTPAKRHPLPDAVVDWIGKYDGAVGDEPVKPFTFELEVL